MFREFMEMEDIKLALRQQWLWGTFIINLVMIAVVWLLSFVPGLIGLGSVMTGLSPKMVHVAVIGALGLWGVFSCAFFLAPAISVVRVRRLVQNEIVPE